MDITSFFPTLIGTATNPDHDRIYEKLVNYCVNIRTIVESGGSGWMSNKTYNTSNGKYDINNDSNFTELNEWVKNQIKDYCSSTEIEQDNLNANGSWFNIYQKNDYQENHVHPTSVISAIYVLKCSDDGARIFFNSPINNMYYAKRTCESQLTASQIICKSVPGTLIIFPSYLVHAVERHESDEIRISLSYNFKQ